MFKSARIKLTAYYLLIIMVVTLFFSVILYSSTTTSAERALAMHERRINNRLSNMPTPPPAPFIEPLNKETINEIRKDTLTTLFIINIFILFVAGISGYWLAGITLRPIEEMIEKQKKFVADAAHELKTPLTAIKTYLEVNLRNQKLNLKESKEIIKSTIQDIDSLTLITNSLLKQSRYQTHNNINLEEFGLKEAIEAVVKKLKHKANEKNIKVAVSGENIKIKANKSEMLELITILLDNAIKFNKTDGSVKLNVFRKDDVAHLEISDTGIGIGKNDLPYIFDRFYKADISRSKMENDGYGLGLSIAKEITKIYKGKISVKSIEGAGTTFIVTLPLR